MVKLSSKHKHLYNICTMLHQLRSSWADVVQMSYKCFMVAGIISNMYTVDQVILACLDFREFVISRLYRKSRIITSMIDSIL